MAESPRLGTGSPTSEGLAGREEVEVAVAAAAREGVQKRAVTRQFSDRPVAEVAEAALVEWAAVVVRAVVQHSEFLSS